MAIVRWNPLGSLAGMEVDRLNRMFADFQNEAFNQAWVPAVDIYETDGHEVVIKAELPDVKKEDINVTFENNVLTLSGERKQEETTKRGQYQRAAKRRSRSRSPSTSNNRLAPRSRSGRQTRASAR